MGWYRHSLISASPSKGMGALVGALAGLIPGVNILASTLVGWAVWPSYYHVTNKAGSYRLNKHGDKTGKDCRDNPGWPITPVGLAAMALSTGFYHAVAHWKPEFYDQADGSF